MLNIRKANSFVIKKSDCESGYSRQFDEVKWRKVIGEAIDGLINAGYVCVVRGEDCGVCVIDYNYADRSFGDYYPVWLLPEEEESVVYEEYKEEERYTKVHRKKNVYDNQLYRTEYVPSKPKKRSYPAEFNQRCNQTFSHSSSKYKNVPSKIKSQVDLDRQHYYEMTHPQKKNDNIEKQYKEETAHEEDNKITTQFQSKALQSRYNEELKNIPKINSLTMSSGSNTINSNNMNSNEIPNENVEKNENELTFKNTTIDNNQIPRQNDNVQFNTAPQEENTFQLSNYSISEQTKNIFKQTMK